MAFVVSSVLQLGNAAAPTSPAVNGARTPASLGWHACASVIWMLCMWPNMYKSQVLFHFW